MLSGVLATVASSLVLAHHMWPYVVSEESMHHVWHTFESLGNIIIFFLAGSITGSIVVDIDPIDIINLLVIYLFLLFMRGGLLFASKPILKLLSSDNTDVTWQELTLMTWGGLRGAVGLALAIVVNNDLAPHIDTQIPQIAKKDGERLLFFVSGIAFLTMLVNATTAPALVLKLGITAQPGARMTLMKMFNAQLLNWSQDSSYPAEVTEALREMLNESQEEFSSARTDGGGPVSLRTSATKSQSQVIKLKRAGTMLTQAHQMNHEIVAELQMHETWYKAQPPEKLQLLGQELEANTFCQVEDIVELVRDTWVDEGMAKVVNHCFMTMVYNKYWHLIDEGFLRPGSPEADALFTSVRVSLSPYRADLTDYDHITSTLVTHDDFRELKEGSMSSIFGSEALGPEKISSGQSCLSRAVQSWQFNLAVVVVILANSLQVVCEEIWRDDIKRTPCDEPNPMNDSPIWLVLDLFFTSFFFVEFLMKLGCMKLKYFGTWWNRFDFLLWRSAYSAA